MTQNEDKSSSPLTHAGIGALILALLAALFGLKSAGKSDAVKSQGAEDKTASVAPMDPSGSKEPHLTFILNNLRPKPIPAAARPLAWHVSAGSAAAAVANLDGPSSDPELSFTPEEAQRLKVIIATVPDPIDTAFGFWYDQLLEGLMRAVCDTDFYQPGGQWTPWEQYRIEAPGKDKKSEAWPPGPPFRHFPGVLLFRSTEKDKRDHVFAVLLVGETTGSIAAAPLYRALALARNVQPAEEPIRLIAPVFTGARPSLVAALKEWRRRDPKAHFTVISGSSADGMSDTAEDPAITLKSTMIPIKILAHAALEFLRGNSSARDSHKVVQEELDVADAAHLYEHVALLVESNTGFGRAMLKSDTKKNKQQDWPMYLPYPMHLLRLQKAYLKMRMEKEQRIGLGGPLERTPDDRSVLPNPDTLPSMAESVTAAINDGAVDDMTAAIRQNRIRYVGILATDPQDKVFLVERLRRDCPNVDIFLNHMDRVYLLPENQQIMRGVIISSTYPIYPPNQGWTDSHDPRRQTFKSQCGQGYYNAAAFHLADLLVLDAKKKHELLARWLQEYSPPSFTLSDSDKMCKPPVWLMTIGEKGQLVPLTFFNDYKTKVKDLMAVASPSTVSPEKAKIMLPNFGPYHMMCFVVLGAVGTVLWFSIRGSRRWLFFGSESKPAHANSSPDGRQRSRAFKEWRQRFRAWFTAPMDKAEQNVSLCHSLILAGLANCLIPALSIVIIVLLTPAFDKHILERIWFVAMAVCLGLAVLCSFLLLWRIVVRFWFSRHTGRSVWWLRFLAHGALLAGALVFAGVLVYRFPADPRQRVLFVTRSADFLTGYSVLPPLLLLAAGFFLYGFLALKRDYLAAHFRVECPYPPLADTAAPNSPVAKICGKINELAAQVRDDMTDFPGYCARHRSLLNVGALILICSAALIVAHGLRIHGTREGRFWDVLFFTWFLMLAILVLLMLLRFIAGWKGLERMLKLMALVPMVRAFDRLPRKTAALFGGYFFTRRPRVSHLEIPAHILRQLQYEAYETWRSAAAATGPEAAATAPATTTVAPSPVLPALSTPALPTPTTVLPTASIETASAIAPAPTAPELVLAAAPKAGQPDEQPANGPQTQAVPASALPALTSSTSMVPLLTGPTTAAQPAAEASNGAQLQTNGSPTGILKSQMPTYDAVPEEIAKRLSTASFDFMPTAAAPEPDRPYPADQINNFSFEAQKLIGNLRPYWPWHTVADAFGEQVRAPEPEKKDRDDTSAMPAWVEKAEDFVAIQAIVFLSQYFILLRTTVLGMVWVAVMLLLAATAYVFQPERLILYLLLGLLSAVVGVILWVLIRVNKNEIISRITQSTPNRFELNWSFVLATVQFIGPIAIIAIAHFSGRLRTVIDPFLKVLP
ncbi:MAG TPA: hypothetical protein VKE98_07640 [Gemmataceae bacterium]|nr:hypothetical protein [Gemmataceae bacterium]